MIRCHCRENQLALRLMCKQHEKKDMTSGVKSLPLLRRELEYLEDYFVYKEEIDSNENCIVLTCSLSKNNVIVMQSPIVIIKYCIVQNFRGTKIP